MSGTDASDYTTYPSMVARWNKVKRKMAFKARDISEWEAWSSNLRGKLASLTGYDTMQTAPLEPQILEEKEFPDYLRQKIKIQTEPGVHMPFYVLIPKKDVGPFPAVINPHGHASGGKYSVAGCREIPEIAQQIDEYNYDYGVQFVRQGFISFCPDARGFGERQEEDIKKQGILHQSCLPIHNMAIPLGQTLSGMMAWDLHRLIDYIETRGDCCGGGVACAGLSGGGLQTLWASIFDQRIHWAIISGYFYGYKEALIDGCMNCSCNYVPHLFEHVDMGDLGALIAPRPLLIETGDIDPLNGSSGVANVLSQVKITREAYDLHDAGGDFRHVIFEGPHRWHGKISVPWLKQMVEGNKGK